MTTMFAVSSGRPPAAIAVIRISGPAAFAALATLAGPVPPPRRASIRVVRDATGDMLDRALVLAFPAPASATGDDLVELHCHGGRAVIAAVERALAALPGLRRADAGEFTRRALANGRIDLAEAEGLADLLAAETECQRRAAMSAVEGRVSRAVRGWLDRIAMLAARVEATLDFADEGDVAGDDQTDIRAVMISLATEIGTVTGAPPVERLRDGIRVVLAGPPNSGKSTLVNLLGDREAAIVSPVAGTTRDRIEVPVVRDGIPYVLVDTAGLSDTDDVVERIGVSRASEAITAADILLWLGEDPPPQPAMWLYPRMDLPGRGRPPSGRIGLSRDDQESIDHLWRSIGNEAAALLPHIDELSVNRHQREACLEAIWHLQTVPYDPLMIAEELRASSRALATILGVDATEAMLDHLFGRFCIGK